MSDSDEDAVWVDVVPRLDEAAADEAVGKIQDKFKDVSANLGRGIADSLGDATGTLAGQLANHARSIGESLRDEIRSGVEQAGDDFGSILGGGISDILHGNAPDLSGMGGVFGDLFNVDSVRELRDTWDGLGGVFKDIGHGDVFGGLGGLRETLNGMNVDGLNGLFDKIDSISQITSKISDHDPLGALNSALTMLGHSNVADGLSQVQEILNGNGGGGFSDDLRMLSQFADLGSQEAEAFGKDHLAGGLGKAATLAMGGAGMADVLGGAYSQHEDGAGILDSLMQGGSSGAAMGAMFGPAGAALGGAIGMLATSISGLAGEIHRGDPRDRPSSDFPIDPRISDYSRQIDDYATGLGGDIGNAPGLGMHPVGPFTPGVGYAGPIPGVSTYDDHQTIGGGAAYGEPSTIVAPMIMPTAAAGGAPSSVNTQEMDVRAGVVNVGGSLNIPGLSVPAPASAAGTAGAAGGGKGGATTHAPAVSPGGGVGNAGGLPTSVLSHHYMGGIVSHYDTGGILPGDSPGYDNMIGLLPSGMAVGLEGGEGVINPAAMQIPGVSDLVGHLQGYSGGSGDAGILDFGPPGGTEPGPRMPQGAAPGSVGGAPKQTPDRGDPHGTGKGFGVGGGVIGAAEGAAAMAASMTPAGPAGGMAAQIAEQEANRAVAYGGQVAGILGIEMPLDTLSINGGKLANLGQSWIGKAGLGMVGQHHDSPNMAGQTQAPIPPTQPPAQPIEPEEMVGGRPGPTSGAAVHIENQNFHNNADVRDMQADWARSWNAHASWMTP